MLNNSHSLTLPISFDEVPYFKNSFRGDLIVTQGVLYYFPHTNTLARENYAKSAALEIASKAFGLGALPLELAIRIAWAMKRTTVNQARIRDEGLWKAGDSSRTLQERLDGHIAKLREESPRLVLYEETVPRPMRFVQTDVRNMKLGLGLRFDTEFDSHDFRIAIHRRRLLQDALWMAGFLK
jgi:hypothetical protein